MNYWQMTFDELDREAFQPVRKLSHPGTYHFVCPVCGEYVGLYKNREYDPVTYGLIHVRETCKNGHAMDWSLVPEEREEHTGRV